MHSQARPFPLMSLVAAAVLLFGVLVAVGAARQTGAGASVAAQGAPVLARELAFEDRPDGSILVRDAGAGRDVTVLEPGTNGFIRGTLRALVRDRRREEVGGRAPFRLAAWPDGRLTLEDPATGRIIGLEAFGPTNMESFARLLIAEGATQ